MIVDIGTVGDSYNSKLCEEISIISSKTQSQESHGTLHCSIERG